MLHCVINANPHPTMIQPQSQLTLTLNPPFLSHPPHMFTFHFRPTTFGTHFYPLQTSNTHFSLAPNFFLHYIVDAPFVVNVTNFTCIFLPPTDPDTRPLPILLTSLITIKFSTTALRNLLNSLIILPLPREFWSLHQPTPLSPCPTQLTSLDPYTLFQPSVNHMNARPIWHP
jgi:hypothetical protein